MSVVQVLGALVVVALVTLAIVWRRRTRDLPSSGSVLPPAPLRPVRGFRVLDGSEPEEPHRIELPRIVPPDHLIGDHPLTVDHVTSPPSVRHDESWALARSLSKTTHPRSRRRRRRLTLVVALALAVIAVVTWWWWPVTTHAPLGLISAW